MDRFYQLCLDHPRRTLAVCLLLTLVLGAGLPRLELRTDGEHLLPSDDPTILRDAEDRARFRDPRALLLVAEAGPGAERLASPAGFEALRELDAALRELPELHTTGSISLASLPRFTRRPSAAFEGAYLDDVPSDPDAFAMLLADVRARPLTDGLLLSSDGRHAVFWLPVRDEVDADTAATALEAFCDAHATPELDLIPGGPLVAESTLGLRVLRDLTALVPLMLVVIVLLLFAMTRCPGGVMVPMLETLLVLIWTFGAMGWAGVPIALVSTILPVVLMAISITDEVHLLERMDAYAGAPDMRARIGAALIEVGRPIVLTSLTTALGFLSFTSASIAPLREFGVFAAFGIVVAMLLTFSFVPALILVSPEWFFAPARRTPIDRPLGSPAAFVARRPGVCFVVGLALVLALLPGLSRLRVSDAWVDNFDPDDSVVRAQRVLDSSFWGAYRLDVVLDGPSGLFRSPEGVRLIERVRARVAQLEHVGGSETHLGLIEDFAEILHATPPVSRLGSAALSDLFRLAELSEGGAGLHRLMTPDGATARVRLYVQDASYTVARTLEDVLDADLAVLIGDGDVLAHFSGDLAVARALVDAIVYNQLRSIGWAIVTIAILLLLYSRRASALFALVPVLASTLALLGGMGIAGVELGIATSMFAALAVGVGVDFGIHFLHRFDREVGGGIPHAQALGSTLASTGRALFWNVIVLSVGFMVLVASELKPNRSLGLLLAAATFACYAGTLLLLPCLLGLRERLRAARRATAMPRL